MTFQEFHDTYTQLTEAEAKKILLTVKRFGSTKFILIKVNSHATVEESD
jgi:hypothetical protein